MKAMMTLIAGATLAFGAASAAAQNYVQTNLVSSIAGIARTQDPTLGNPWGLARGPTTAWWMSDLNFGVAKVYDGAGRKLPLEVAVPPIPASIASGPAGALYNGSATDFLLKPGRPATFLFGTIDGTISGWNADVQPTPTKRGVSTQGVAVVKNSDGSAYTGLATAIANGKRYLYAANFRNGRIDVFDSAFHRVTLTKPSDDANEPFVDDQLPENFHPFNVQAIGNDVVVTYALLMPGGAAETDGPGLGYVDIYDASGQLLKRLEHGDWLNAPWGVALAPLDFGRYSHDLLVGQFAGAGDTASSGYIAAYDLATGKLDGLLQGTDGKPLSIKGIFAISPGNTGPNIDHVNPTGSAQLYFTAGPNGGADGLFGYLTAAPDDVDGGNGQ